MCCFPVCGCDLVCFCKAGLQWGARESLISCWNVKVWELVSQLNLAKDLEPQWLFISLFSHFLFLLLILQFRVTKCTLGDTSILHIPRSTLSDLIEHVDIETQAMALAWLFKSPFPACQTLTRAASHAGCKCHTLVSGPYCLIQERGSPDLRCCSRYMPTPLP